MANLTFEEISNLGKEAVSERFQYAGENETPLYNWLNSKKKRHLDQQGYRMPVITVRPGGHNAYLQSASDFRTPVPMKTDSMRVYPTWYQIGHSFDGATLRGLRARSETYLTNYVNVVKLLTGAAKKRLNQIFHGDGTGAVAVCGSVITGTGSVTLTGLTLASSGAGEAETKGTKRLEKGHTYMIMNASTGAIKAVFTVTTPGKTSCTVNVTTHNANTASGDPIVDGGLSASVSTYRKWAQGLRSLCASTGYLQGVDRASLNEFATPRINGGDLPVTPFVFAQAKTLVEIGANDMSESEGLVMVMTPGQHLALRIQQFGYREYKANENVKGVAKKYVDQEGDEVILDADGAEDRICLLDGNSYYLGEEKPFGLYNEDGNDLRMIAGANSVGSDGFYLAIGWGGNLIKDIGESRVQCDAYIDRLSQTDVMQQTSV